MPGPHPSDDRMGEFDVNRVSTVPLDPAAGVATPSPRRRRSPGARLVSTLLVLTWLGVLVVLRLNWSWEWQPSFEGPTSCNVGERCRQLEAASMAHRYIIILDVLAVVLVLLTLAGIAALPASPRDARRASRVGTGIAGALLVSLPVVLMAGIAAVWMLLAATEAAAGFAILAAASALVKALSRVLSYAWSDRSRRGCAAVGFVATLALVMCAPAAYEMRIGVGQGLVAMLVVEALVLVVGAAALDPRARDAG